MPERHRLQHDANVAGASRCSRRRRVHGQLRICRSVTDRVDVDSPFYGYLFKLPSDPTVLTSHSRGLTKDDRALLRRFRSIPLPMSRIGRAAANRRLPFRPRRPDRRRSREARRPQDAQEGPDAAVVPVAGGEPVTHRRASRSDAWPTVRRNRSRLRLQRDGQDPPVRCVQGRRPSSPMARTRASTTTHSAKISSSGTTTKRTTERISALTVRPSSLSRFHALLDGRQHPRQVERV